MIEHKGPSVSNLNEAVVSECDAQECNVMVSKSGDVNN